MADTTDTPHPDPHSDPHSDPRGREAARPSEIPLKGWKDIALRIKDEIDGDNVGLVAAGVAFYGLLALFPLITALVAIGGIVVDPAVVQAQADALAGVLPAQAADIILGQVTEVAGAAGGALGFAAVFGLLLALYSASKGVDNMIRGLNIAYDETETRGFIRYKLTVLALTLGLVLGILSAVLVAAALPAVLAIFGEAQIWATLAAWLRWPALLLIGAGGITVLYRYGPCRTAAKWRWLTPGAIVATLLWVAGSAGFAWYVQNFATYNETFGTLGGVIVLLMWLWISSYIVLLGAELDSEMEAQTKRDTTVGKTRPMGMRGAVKADKLGAAAGASSGAPAE